MYRENIAFPAQQRRVNLRMLFKHAGRQPSVAKKRANFSDTFNLEDYDAYMVQRPLEQRIMVEYIKEKLKKKKSILIVELGAGTGRFTKLYVGLPCTKTILVEPDSKCREQLRMQFNVGILDEAAEEFSLKSKADVIVMATAFHHVPFTEKLRALQNIRNALKKDGWFLCGDNFLAEYKTMTERTVVLRKSMKKWLKDAAHDPKDLAMAKHMNNIVFRSDHGGEYFMCTGAFEALATKAGLSIEGKSNCSNTDPLDMEHYFYLLKKQ